MLCADVRPFEPASVDPIGGEITVPVIPKLADEFTCMNCFLIQHVSRLASSEGGELICTDCAEPGYTPSSLRRS
jgi:Domain of unknown function (DUF4193)